MIHIWYGIGIVAALVIGTIIGYKKAYDLPPTKKILIVAGIFVLCGLSVAAYFMIAAQ